jgi:hypothetical protein
MPGLTSRAFAFERRDVELTVDTSSLTKLERALATASEKNFRFAVAQALNDTTRAASRAVNKAMPDVFDRPTPFTDRAAIAPRELAATKTNFASTVTLRPIQAQYLTLEEEGGTRTPAMNTRKPGAAALVLPSQSLPLDQYGNIPDGTVQTFRAKAAADKRARVKADKARKRGKVAPAPPRTGSVTFLPADAPGNKAHVAGFFQRLDRTHIQRLTAFKPETHYHAHMGYQQRVAEVFEKVWPVRLLDRLLWAFATAR